MPEPKSAEEVAELVGGRVRLARLCGVDKSTPYSWRVIPPVHVPAVAEATGLPPHVLRPDLPQLFPASDDADA